MKNNTPLVIGAARGNRTPALLPTSQIRETADSLTPPHPVSQSAEQALACLEREAEQAGGSFVALRSRGTEMRRELHIYPASWLYGTEPTYKLYTQQEGGAWSWRAVTRTEALRELEVGA